MLRKSITLTVLLALAILAGCSDSNSPTEVRSSNAFGGSSSKLPLNSLAEKSGHEGMTIVETAISINEDTGEFSTLIAALVAADLVGALDGKKQFTVFAPTDGAFADLGYNADNIGDLPVADLTNILLYHVAPGRRYAEDVVSSDRVRMLNKQFAYIEVMGSDAFINESQIVQTDVEASNGIIHVINAVLLPGSGMAASESSIVDVALAVNSDTGEFSTLIAALTAANLVNALDGKRQLTVFAPVDAAFAALGYNADNIGDLPVEDLTNILLYHVAPGRRYAEDVVESDQIRMLNGGFTSIEVVGSDAFINDSQIVQTDIEASNGVIHIINAVLLP